MLMAEIHHEGKGAWFARRIRYLSRYYCVRGQLPPELRGGLQKGTSRLYDSDVERCARTWLSNQAAGTITPAKFRVAINDEILPSLCVVLKNPLSQRTATRWLRKLGYRKVTIRKGIYMDGHERPDVVEYRNLTYLPKMLECEARMTRYEGPDLIPHPPNLKPGERRIIAYFHDECAFSANDYNSTAW